MRAFERTARLLGREAVDRLAASAVAVFGLGGVGSYAAEALARAGVPAEAVTLVDQSENWWTPEAVRV